MAGASSDELGSKGTPMRGLCFLTRMITITSASHLEMYPELLPLSAGSAIGAVVIGRLYPAPSQAMSPLPMPCTSQPTRRI